VSLHVEAPEIFKNLLKLLLMLFILFQLRDIVETEIYLLLFQMTLGDKIEIKSEYLKSKVLKNS